VGILRYGARLGYSGAHALRLSQNYSTVALDPAGVTRQVDSDLSLGRIAVVDPIFPFISSPLGLVPKPNGTFRRIHDLTYPKHSKHSPNAGIIVGASSIEYIQFDDITEMILEAGKGCYLFKKDVKDAFRIIPVAPADRWLLGFMWNDHYYNENCLPFGLSTAPILFNLFAEALHWILQSYLHLQFVLHYLDDFIFALPKQAASTQGIQQFHKSYKRLTDALGVPRNDLKDEEGTCITILGYEFDSVAQTARLTLDKLEKARSIATEASCKTSMTLHEVQVLAGFLSYCAKVTRLGRIYLRSLWTFMTKFESDGSRWPNHYKRKIPRTVQSDLQWWSTLLPRWNGVAFLSDENRPKVHLYTDASGDGMGGFYFCGAEPS
jgi:hypothetical protein